MSYDRNSSGAIVGALMLVFLLPKGSIRSADAVEPGRANPSDRTSNWTLKKEIVPRGAPTAVSLARGNGGEPRLLLVGIGDSLTHGTLDATNNSTNTFNAYFQRVADLLASEVSLIFSQPLFDDDSGDRVLPFEIPTNLGVDGADSFSIEGIEYFKRVGAAENFETEAYYCDARLPRRLESAYDKVLYPINLKTRRDATALDSAIWLVNEYAQAGEGNHSAVALWIGNNDTSTAALGSGGENPMFLPVPADQIESDITPALRLLLRVARETGLVSFDAYTQTSLERNMTELDDFSAQYARILDRMEAETDQALSSGRMDLFLLTLPYYSSVGYLVDSEDLEFYLRQIDPGYSVPPTFQRVAPVGEPITDPLRGDRVSLLTFGMMYTMLHTGRTVAEVNEVLELGGLQRDDMVLSEAEQAYIAERIDGFNKVIRTQATSRGPHVHLVEVGKYLNDVLTGKSMVVVGGHVISRKWVRGGSFSLDGVHPGYTGHAFIANYVIERMNEALGLNAPPEDLLSVFASDPYIDRDGDGWASGPSYPAHGIAEVLFYLTDADDTDASIGPDIPDDIWRRLSNAILRDVLGVPSIRREAERLGIAAPD